ncbi:MAG: helix-turn-helix domain-containing protein [Spirochaetales bacterium]|nr:helix-turn-helix domain-containing protein [Spirochaetales bacterium]
MYKVLLVEDEYYLREELATTVNWEQYGCKVIDSVSSAEEGLVSAAVNRPDIIVTDIKLPGIDGLEFLRRVEFGAAIIITGHHQFQYARDALRIGVSDFILKPIDDEELHKAVRKTVLALSGRNTQGNTDSLDPVYNDNKARHIACARRFIERHYREDVSLLDAAEHLGLSTSYLSRIFQEKTGTGFVTTLTEYRINIAKNLLQDQSLRIEEIAQMCGFRNAGYFSRIFKRHTGTSPSSFRCTLS